MFKPSQNPNTPTQRRSKKLHQLLHQRSEAQVGTLKRFSLSAATDGAASQPSPAITQRRMARSNRKASSAGSRVSRQKINVWLPCQPRRRTPTSAGAAKSSRTRLALPSGTRLMASSAFAFCCPTTNHQFSSLRCGYLQNTTRNGVDEDSESAPSQPPHQHAERPQPLGAAGASQGPGHQQRSEMGRRRDRHGLRATRQHTPFKNRVGKM